MEESNQNNETSAFCCFLISFSPKSLGAVEKYMVK